MLLRKWGLPCKYFIIKPLVCYHYHSLVNELRKSNSFWTVFYVRELLLTSLVPWSRGGSQWSRHTSVHCASLYGAASILHLHFTNSVFMAGLHQACLSAPFSQQHSLTLFRCHILVILTVFRTLDIYYTHIVLCLWCYYNSWKAHNIF